MLWSSCGAIVKKLSRSTQILANSDWHPPVTLGTPCYYQAGRPCFHLEVHS